MAVMQIKLFRERAGLTQMELAVEMGVCRSAVANWEREISLPLARQLPELARLLNCSIDDLFVSAEAEAV